jgi:hypothetical protein
MKREAGGGLGEFLQSKAASPPSLGLLCLLAPHAHKQRDLPQKGYELLQVPQQNMGNSAELPGLIIRILFLVHGGLFPLNKFAFCILRRKFSR